MKISKSIQADFTLLFITVLWASTFTVVKNCLAQASPVFFIALRFWIAALAVVLFLPGALRGISRQTLRRGLFLSIILSGGYVSQTLGLQTTTPSRCAFITSLFVLFVPILGFLLIRHRPRIRTLCGIAVATVGLALLTLNPHDLTVSQGDGFTLICAFIFALHILYVGRYLSSTDFRQLVVIQLTGTAVLCTVMIPFVEKPFVKWDAGLAAALVLLGVLATALATYLQNNAQRYTTPNRAALIFSLEPFFASVIAYMALGDTLTGRELIGGAFVLAGILTSEISVSRCSHGLSIRNWMPGKAAIMTNSKA